MRGASHSPQIAESPRKTPRSLEKAIPYIAIEDSQALGGVEPFFFCGRFEDEVARWPNRRSLHRHHFYEVFFMQQGRGVCHCDFTPMPFEANRLIFISPGQVHGWEVDSEVRGKIVAFSADWWPGKSEEGHFLYELPLFFGPTPASQLALSPGDAGQFARWFSELELEYGRTRDRSRGILRALLERILLEARRMLPQSAVEPAAQPYRLLARRFFLALEESFRGRQETADYARELGVPVRSLTETLRREVGKTPKRLIEERLALEARRLLAHSPLTVSEIGFELGFADASHFSRFFRRMTGRAPRAFREEGSH